MISRQTAAAAVDADHPFRSELCRRIGHTLPGRVATFAHYWPERCALREKQLGRWREYSWREYLLRVNAFAEALRAHHITAGDRIGIIADNCPEWLFADIGAQSLGVLAAGIYTTNPPADVAYVLNHCRARILVCEDQEQVDKVVHGPEPLPHLERIVVLDAAGTRDYEDPRLIKWDDFLAPTLEQAAAISDADLHARLARLDDRAPAVIVYTSGTTGRPKGALLSAHNMLCLSDVYVEDLGGNADDQLISYLPLCHVAEKVFSEFTPLTSGATVHFGESLDTVRQDVVEVAPTVFLGVPRIWEKLHAGVDVAIRNTTPEKRALYRWALSIAERAFAASAAGRLSSALRAQRALADVLVLRALRERLGLGRCRLAYSGAAPIAPDLLRWFHMIGVPIMEAWGLTESCGISHVNLPGACKIGTVGKPVRGVECRLADDDEVLIRGPHIFLGYLDDEAATRTTIDSQGWLHTGDLGDIDEEGFLSIIGRKKEIIITAGGKNLSPAKIENALKTSPYIKEAAAIGDGRPFISALIQIEADLVGDWATRQGLAFSGYEDLTCKHEVKQMIEREVQRANEQLARVEQVRAFRLMPQELHEDYGEVTATQKLKRNVVADKYARLIDDMYGSRERTAAV
jgi:long-chain acyl-CoA synthetase